MFVRFLGRGGFNMLLEMTLSAQKLLKKPMFLVIEKDVGFGGESVIDEVIERYHDANLATFPDFRLAVRIAGYLADYQSFLDRY
jgi:hypothetical protein